MLVSYQNIKTELKNLFSYRRYSSSKFFVKFVFTLLSSSAGVHQRHSNTNSPRPQKNNKSTEKCKSANRVTGGPNRDLDTLMELQMNKVCMSKTFFLIDKIF